MHSNVHAGISFLFALYGFLYANGSPDSVYFYNIDNQKTMFDIMKYANITSAAYLLYDLVFIIMMFEKDPLAL